MESVEERRKPTREPGLTTWKDRMIIGARRGVNGGGQRMDGAQNNERSGLEKVAALLDG